MKIIIETVLTMYENLSTRTLDLMRERSLRLKAEEALKLSEERWNFVLQDSADSVWDWNIENNHYIQSTDTDHLIKYNSNLNIHPADTEEMHADLQAHLDGKTDLYTNKHRVLQENGKWSWILTRGKVVTRDKDGKPLRMVGTNSDITEREIASLIHQNTTQAIFICDFNLSIVGINPAFTKITGYSEEESIGLNPKFMSSGTQEDEFYSELWKQINDTGHWKGKITNKRKNGEIYLEELSIDAITDTNGHVDYYVAMFNDITFEETLKRTQRQQQETYSLVFENTVSAVLIVDPSMKRFINCNDAAAKLLCYKSAKDILDLSPADISPEFQPDKRRSDEKSEEMIAFAIENGSHEFEWIHLTKDDKVIWVEVILTSIIVDDKKVLHAVLKDIGDKKRAESLLQEQQNILDYEIHHDMLTGLPNRILFDDRLYHAIEKAKRHHTELAVLFIDLDHFKHINDSLGHIIGDKVLQEITNRLKNIIRTEDTLARFGGDEFVIIMDDLARGQDASFLAHKILEALSQPLYIDQEILYVSSSIGISLHPSDDLNGDKLLMYADAAMYRAKAKGRNTFQFYAVEMTTKASEYISMESNLRKALKNKEFVVYYQPQINGKTGKVLGMEALVRWNDPIAGMISPATFIPIAEETGLIVALDQWVMKTAMHQIASWYKKGLNPGILAINLAMKQLEKDNFIVILQNILEETNFNPEWLELEVTESQLMKSPEDTITILNQISSMGIELAIDDFGTGYSSLSYLKRLPVHKLKIDKSFVDGLPDDPEDVGIAKAIIALAQSLKLKVIAEGVETIAQKDFLIQNGCENIQGYYYAKPMSAENLEVMLTQSFSTQT